MPGELIRLRRDAGDLEHTPLARALARHVDGEVRFDRGTRALYATDASNYRQPPLGVVVPRTTDAVAAAVAVCREHGAPVLPRGGGTSLAGQCCNRAVVIDCSRHLRRIEIDAAAGVAHVEPGAILDDLRRAAAPHGLDFGPDPSTHDRCTLGGMLGNNACGTHSLLSEFYGPGPRTSDHVEALDVLTYRGDRLGVGATRPAELRRKLARGGTVAAIYRALIALRDRHERAIRTGFPEIPRRVSGYDLPQLLPERDLHVGRALVGTEATCAIILGASLRLARARPHRVLVVVGYPDIYAAADDLLAVRDRRPVGCEAIDHVLAERVRIQGKFAGALDLLPHGRAWLLIEHGGDTLDEAQAEAARTARACGGGARTAVHADAGVQVQLWQLREAALGATAFAPGRRDPYEGWEDAAVPPAALGAYLREFNALLAAYRLEGALYGHFGQGCVHTRIDFDLQTERGIDAYRRFTLDAARLVVRHGGSISGEHGDGQSRGDLLEVMYGRELVEAFREFKAIWDPDHALNPGKVVDARPRTDDLRLAGYGPAPGPIELAHVGDDHDFAHAAARCVGIGACRRVTHGTMCPSYMVTLDERHSTRGRAHLLFEMIHGGLLDDGWRSDAVHEALDLCLSCKACKRECPVSVDMAAYKAEFLAHYHAHRRRPRAAYAFGWLHRWLVIGRALPALANWATHAPGVAALLKRLAGIAPAREVPRIAARSFRATFRPRPARRGAPQIVLWPDTFHDAFYPEVLHAAAAVLAAAGYAVSVPPARLCCGRPVIEFGWIEPARAMWRHNLDVLTDDLLGRAMVVGVEPSCTAALRDEVRALLPDDPRAHELAARTRTLGELLAGSSWAPPRGDGAALYHRHCHQAAVLDPSREVEVLRRAGFDVDVPDTGCCGMAGAFGFEAPKYDLSVALAERALLPAVRGAPDGALIVTDGFSCREQLRQLAGIRPLHVAEVLARQLGEDR